MPLVTSRKDRSHIFQEEQEESELTDVTGPQFTNNEIFIPRRQEHPVVTRLKDLSLYLESFGAGKHRIICPWQDEHVEAVSGGASYFEPRKSLLGGFKCTDGLCRNRHIVDLCIELGISEIEARNLPTIRLREGRLGEIVGLCEQELANCGNFFQRAGFIARISKDPDTKEITILSVKIPALVSELSRLVRFEKYDKRSEEWNCCDPPERYCKILYQKGNYPHLPVLRGLARQPYLRPDGSLMADAGYDQSTGMFGAFIQNKFRTTKVISRQNAEFALAELSNLLDEFCFKTEHDQSAALSAIFTAAIRPTLSSAPMFHCRAPQSRSGKSYLTSLISAFATGSPASAVPFPSSDNECRKLLLSLLLTSPPVICFDNLMSDLTPYKSLCSALTEEFITDRKLGGSNIKKVSTRTLFLSSGNSVGPVGDMSRRTVTINLNPACDTSEELRWKNKPLVVVLARREYFVTLALIIIRSWIVAGRPATDVKSVATYTDWSDLCRQPLLWLGCPDPAENAFLSIEQDPDREILGRLLHAWHACFNNRSIMIRDAMKMANDELLGVVMDITGDRGRRCNQRLGIWISRHASRIVDDLKFEKNSSTRSAETWRVESVTKIADRPD